MGTNVMKKGRHNTRRSEFPQLYLERRASGVSNDEWLTVSSKTAPATVLNQENTTFVHSEQKSSAKKARISHFSPKGTVFVSRFLPMAMMKNKRRQPLCQAGSQ
jgi:hypothetical protein